MGADIREMVLEIQGDDWFSSGRRVLDFGCGSGKLLRHFLAEAEDCEFIGCDIDAPSIEWLRESFSPPLSVFVCGEEPGLPLPDEHVDLVLAISVFTHIFEHWAAWLLEIHRLLRPGGRFICTFLGRGMSQAVAGEPWDADRIGMNVLCPWQPWERGGPSVQHSEWWLRAYWGRAFEFERIEDRAELGHGLLVLRKRDVELDEEDLRRPERNEPREVAALRHNVARLAEEITTLNASREAFMAELEAIRSDRELVDADRDALRRDRDRVASDREHVSGALEMMRGDRERLTAQLDCARDEVRELTRERDLAASAGAALQAQISEMRATASWRWATRYWKMRGRMRGK